MTKATTKTKTNPVPLYFSREDRVARDTLSFDPHNMDFDYVEAKLGDEVDELVGSVLSLNEELTFYMDAVYAGLDVSPIDDDLQEEIDNRRTRVEQNWGFAQVALSRVAKILGIDGNQRFQQTIDEEN